MSEHIDIKYLKIVYTLTSCRSVTHAAKILGISPASVSYAINKLRKITGVHLFIRSKSGMIPDTIALELSARYTKIISDTSNSYESAETESDDKKTTIIIRSNSLFEAMFSLSLLDIEKNKYRFKFIPPVNDINERMFSLKNKEVDIDVGMKLYGDTSISKFKLFTSGISVLSRKDSNITNFTMENWRNNKHIVWSNAMEYYFSDFSDSIAIKKLLDERDVSIVSESGINMVAHCAYGDGIMLIPNFFVPFLGKHFPVKSHALPNNLSQGYDCYLHCHNTLIDRHDIVGDINDIVSKIKSHNFINFR